MDEKEIFDKELDNKDGKGDYKESIKCLSIFAALLIVFKYCLPSFEINNLFIWFIYSLIIFIINFILVTIIYKGLKKDKFMDRMLKLVKEKLLHAKN